jgi:hypothetical protein
MKRKKIEKALRSGVMAAASDIVNTSDADDQGRLHHMLHACTDREFGTSVIDSAVRELCAMAFDGGDIERDVRAAPDEWIKASAAHWAGIFLRRYVLELSRELSDGRRVL